MRKRTRFISFLLTFFSLVFGGPLPISIPLSTTWAKLHDELRSQQIQGWVLSAAGTSPGSVLGNETFASATDKSVRILMQFSRGSTFLLINITYSSSLAILIGAILGYFSGLMSLGSTVMRITELIHQRGGKTPPSVTHRLRQLSSFNGSDTFSWPNPKLKAASTLQPVEL